MIRSVTMGRKASDIDINRYRICNRYLSVYKEAFSNLLRFTDTTANFRTVQFDDKKEL